MIFLNLTNFSKKAYVPSPAGWRHWRIKKKIGKSQLLSKITSKCQKNSSSFVGDYFIFI